MITHGPVTRGGLACGCSCWRTARMARRWACTLSQRMLSVLANATGGLEGRNRTHLLHRVACLVVVVVQQAAAGDAGIGFVSRRPRQPARPTPRERLSPLKLQHGELRVLRRQLLLLHHEVRPQHLQPALRRCHRGCRGLRCGDVGKRVKAGRGGRRSKSGPLGVCATRRALHTRPHPHNP